MEKIKNFLFRNSGVRQTIVKNVIWLTSGVTISRVIRSLMIIYAARILGTTHYGIFSYTLSLAAVFSIFADIGLTGILTRELIKRDKKKEFLATSLVIKLTLVAITTILIAFVSPFFTNIAEARPIMIAMAFLIAFDGIRNFLFAIYRAENKMQFEAVFEIITEIFITSIGFVVLIKFPSAMNLAVGYMIASGLSLLLVLFFIKKYLAKIFSYFRRYLVPEILKIAWPFAFVGVFGVLMTSIDSVIIGAMLPVVSLGLYAAAQKPIGLLSLIPGFLYSGLFPFFSKFSNERNIEKFSLLIKKSMIISLGLALPIVCGGIIIADPLIRVIYGPEYIGATQTFQVLLLMMLLVFPNTILSGVLLAKNKQKIFVRSSMIGAVVNIILDLILIPLYGIVGSAIATFIVQLAVTIIYVREINRENKIYILKDMLKIIIATVVMSGVVIVMKITLWPIIYIIIISALIYFSLLFLFKEKLIKDLFLSFQGK